MSRIITISREFGSGGRELGRRIAHSLGIPCYDHQIIEMVAERQGLDKNYVANLSERDIEIFYPTTISQCFSLHHYSVIQTSEINDAEHELIRELASQGDCVIVGRCADILLEDMDPFKIFVFSSDSSKLARCKANAKEGEQLSDKEIIKKIRDVDRRRRSYRAMYDDKAWGDATTYNLSIDTSHKDIKALSEAVVGYINAWYGQ
jgi:cytidylate kinase